VSRRCCCADSSAYLVQAFSACWWRSTFSGSRFGRLRQGPLLFACQGERWTFSDVVCRSCSGCWLRQAVGRCAGLLVDRFSGLCFFSFSRARFSALLFFLARAVSAFSFRCSLPFLLSSAAALLAAGRGCLPRFRVSDPVFIGHRAAMRAAASGPRSGLLPVSCLVPGRDCPDFPSPFGGRVAGGRDRVPGSSPAAALGRVGRSWRPVEPLRLLPALFGRVLAPMPCRQSWSVWRASMARLRRFERRYGRGSACAVVSPRLALLRGAGSVSRSYRAVRVPVFLIGWHTFSSTKCMPSDSVFAVTLFFRQLCLSVVCPDLRKSAFRKPSRLSEFRFSRKFRAVAPLPCFLRSAASGWRWLRSRLGRVPALVPGLIEGWFLSSLGRGSG
jgi:hypothetical protein